MNNFLYYNTPFEQFQTCYSVTQFPFKADSVTQLPKNIAVIRAVATLALTGLIAFKLARTVFCLPVVIAGVAFAGWTIYSHVCSKDPLMEAFYKISGGKDKFEQLPEIQLEQNSGDKISAAIHKLNWDDLKHPIAKAKTLDGRNVIIIKGLTRNNEKSLFSNCQTKGTLVFVEKLGPYDIPRTISNLHELAASIMYAIFSPLQGNSFDYFLSSSSYRSGNMSSSNYSKIYASISKDMANELFTQLVQ